MADIYTKQDLLKVTKGDIVTTSIVLRGNGVKTLGSIKRINGDLGLSDSALESLGELREVKGDFWLSHHNVSPRLTSLGKLQSVGGSANLCHWYFDDLGELTHVGGNLSLRDTELSSLGQLSFVGGNLSLPKRFKDSSEANKVTVKGKLSFWNSSKKNSTIKPVQERLSKSFIPVPEWQHFYVYKKEDISSASWPVRFFYSYYKKCFLRGHFIELEGNNNYAFILLYDLSDQYATFPERLASLLNNLAENYPVTKGYAIEAIFKYAGSAISDEEALRYIKCTSNLSIYYVRYFEDQSGHGLVDADIALDIAGNSLTQFGQSNAEEIKHIFREKFNAVNKLMNGHFLDLFFDKGLPYKLVNGDYSQEYYRQFYSSSESFERNKAYDGYGGGYYWENNYHVVEHAVTEYLSSLLKQSEDEYRVSVGIPKIGEGWVSETDLFYKVKERFSEYNVIQHGRPEWLGRQHLDIYFPDLNIAIEYQGLQHYQPVDYFGGEKGFSATKERDKRKYNLCKKNGCQLLYVDESHTFDEVAEAIQKLIISIVRG